MSERSVFSESDDIPLVLLATNNSEGFIRPLLDSLRDQAGVTLSVLISDDRSSDSIVRIANEYEGKGAVSELICLTNTTEWHGVVGNFSYLCQQALRSGANTFFFCDHDDEWAIDKVARSLSLFSSSSANEEEQPFLVFSDLNVTDEHGDELHRSFVEYQGLPAPPSQPLAALLHQNVVTGCTVAFNRRLLEIAAPIPKCVLMHDHWFGLCSRVFGDWSYIETPLVRYRQHGNNAIGASSASKTRDWLSPDFYKMLLNFPQHFAQSIIQAQALYSRMLRYPELTQESDKELISRYCNLPLAGVTERLVAGHRYFLGQRSFGERVYITLILLFLPFIFNSARTKFE